MTFASGPPTAAALSGVGLQAPAGPPRGRPPPELKEYRGGIDEQDEAGFRIRGRVLITLLFVFGAVFVVLLLVYRSQVKELGLPENERELAQAMASRGMGTAGVSSREVVFDAVSKTGGWVTPGRVGLAAGISTEEAEAMLGDLLAEGRIKSGRDKQGRRLYRLVG